MLDYSTIRKRQQYLPAHFRDEVTHNAFDNQRDFFRMVMSLAENDFASSEAKNLKEAKYNWRNLHINAVDVFLYSLARYGYMFVRSRKKLNFADYEAWNDEITKFERKLMATFLKNKDEPYEEEKFPVDFKVSEDVLAWVNNQEHLPKEFRGSNFTLLVAFLLKSIRVDDDMLGPKLTFDDRFYLSKILLDNAAKYGYVLRKQKKEGNFDNLLELVEPYRKGYEKMLEAPVQK